jgi:biotin carboxyl carrier protein
MRKFNIKVNGKAYEVEVEELSGGTVAPAYTPAPVAAPQPAAAPASAKAPEAPKAAPAAAPAGSTVVNAPMPGTILDIKVKVGDTVKSGDVLCILEAMKMENEIMAPKDGTVVAVNTSKGASVNNGDALVSLG